MKAVNFIYFGVSIWSILVNCRGTQLIKRCAVHNCRSFKPITKDCGEINYLYDPFNKQCTAKCNTPCVDGTCKFCYCYHTDKNDGTAQFSDCDRIVGKLDQSGQAWNHEYLKSCDDNYVRNPYDTRECVLACNGDSSPGKHYCGPYGYSGCPPGYRHNITNPRYCVDNTKSNTQGLQITCGKGFDLNHKDECVSRCGDCKNGGCDADGICRCWKDYKMNVTTLTCELQESDSLAGDSLPQNISLSADGVSKRTFNTYIIVLSCISAVFLISTIVLVFVVLKLTGVIP